MILLYLRCTFATPLRLHRLTFVETFPVLLYFNLEVRVPRDGDQGVHLPLIERSLHRLDTKADMRGTVKLTDDSCEWDRSLFIRDKR